jgi:hypothetical protein
MTHARIDMHPPRSMCGPNVVSLGCMGIEKLTYLRKFSVILSKSVD